MLLPLAGQWQPGPESKHIRFSGYDWIVKDSSSRVGPGSNLFAEDAVRVDTAGLRLRVVEKAGRFYCAEVVSTATFGYGTYRFHVASNANLLASNVVLGLFTWLDDPGEEGSHKELDIELGRWGNPENDVAQFVIQPYDRSGHIVRFPLPPNSSSSIHTFTWAPNQAHFTSEVRGVIVRDHTFTRGIPVPGGENARINLWITGGRIPTKGLTEIVIKSFEFIPLARK